MITRYYKNGVEVSEADNPTQVEHTHRIYKVRQMETGEVYPTAVDPYPSRYTYEVSDVPQDTSAITPEPDPNTLDGISALKLAECEEWNASSAVCEFYFNGLPMWLSREERADLLASLQAMETLGVPESAFSFKGVSVVLSVALGKQLLASIQLYASHTESIKQQRLIEIAELTTIEAVNEYEYKGGYPDKLIFEL